MTANLTVQETEPVPGEEIRAFIERAEAINAKIADEREDLKNVFAEAKGRGYDVKVLRQIIARRKRDRDDLAEEAAILELYENALGA